MAGGSHFVQMVFGMTRMMYGCARGIQNLLPTLGQTTASPHIAILSSTPRFVQPALGLLSAAILEYGQKRVCELSVRKGFTHHT